MVNTAATYQPFVVLALPAYLVIIMISDDMHYTLGVKDAQPSVVVVVIVLLYSDRCK